MLRRQFLQFLLSAGGATTAATLLPAGGDQVVSPGAFQQDHRATWESLAAVDPEQVEEVVGYLRRVHGVQYGRLAARPSAPAHTIPSHVALIERLLRLDGIAGGNKDDLLNMGARYAEFASWLHQDSGDRERRPTGSIVRWDGRRKRITPSWSPTSSRARATRLRLKRTP